MYFVGEQEACNTFISWSLVEHNVGKRHLQKSYVKFINTSVHTYLLCIHAFLHSSQMKFFTRIFIFQQTSSPQSDTVPNLSNQKSPASPVSPGTKMETTDTWKNEGGPASTVERSTESKKSPIIISGIEFAPSAEEARKRMAKKSRVKEENLSIRDKFRLFERL